MNDTSTTALISALVAAFVSLLASLLLARTEARKVRSGLAKVLYIRRLDAYPKLLAIIQQIGKEDSLRQFSKDEIVKTTQECFDNMVTWQTETDGYLLLSKTKSLEAFRNLKDLIKRTVRGGVRKDGSLPYDKDRLREIFVARNVLRGTLRDDIDALYDYEMKDRLLSRLWKNDWK